MKTSRHISSNAPYTWVLLLMLLWFNQSAAQILISKFSFTIAVNCRVSAGVFNPMGQLIRTLWNNRPYTPGTYTEYWDRKDDRGQVVYDTNYRVRLLSNNVQYQWEGVVGNNSDSLIGSSKVRAFQRFNSMSIAGDFAYYSIGYSEGIPSSYKLNLRHPKNKINILDDGQNNTDLQCDYVSTDGNKVYWAGFDPFNPGTSFVFATKCSDDKEHIFNKGITQSTIYGRKYLSVIQLRTSDLQGHPSGLAVQKSGNLLAIAYKDLGLLKLCDKNSGDSISVANITQPREIAFDQNDKLWMITDRNSVCSYNISNGQLSQVTCLSGLESPLALAVSPNNSVLVIDGGSSQQIKIYSTSGVLIKTIGSKGGYQENPLVNDYKFYFSDTYSDLTKPFAAFAEDSSFWIGDVGNERVMHYDKNGIYVEHIICMPHTYSIAADKNNPSRVFNEMLEFSVDYSKPLAASNGSWALKRNYRAGWRQAYFQSDRLRIFNQLTTLSNGRTYAFLDSFSGGIRIPVLVELPDSSNIRYSNILLDNFAQDILESSGDFRKFRCSLNAGDSGFIVRRQLNGFSDGWPVWDQEDTLAVIPTIDTLSPAYLSLQSLAVCNDKNILFNAGKDSKGFHLGAIANGDRQYSWLAGPSTYPAYSGPMPVDGTFDIGNQVQYPGGAVIGSDSTLFWNYHGEFWKNSQTNIWNHYHANGLMLAQFGITTPEGEQIRKEAFPQGAGNVFSIALVKTGTDIYIYHNDESVHGGMHRWKVTGLNSIKTQNIAIQNISIKKGGLKGSYFKGSGHDPLNLEHERIDPIIDQLELPESIKGQSLYSIAHSGFLQCDTGAGFELEIVHGGAIKFYLNDHLYITSNNPGTNKFSFDFSKGQPYPIRIESQDIQISLKWNRNGTSQVIPEKFLSPDIFQITEGLDLMYGLTSGSDLTDDAFGWSYNFTLTNNSRTAKVGVKSSGNSVDISAVNYRHDSAFIISRNLKGIKVCKDRWALEGTLNYENCYPETNVGGLSIDLLDSSGKTLAELRYEMLKLPEYGFPTRLNCNGEPIINLPFAAVKNFLSDNPKFRLEFNPNGITFQLGDLVPLNVPSLDPTANWQAPGSFNIRFSPTSDNQMKTVNVGKLRLKGMQSIRLVNLGEDTICQDGYTYLMVSNSAQVLWNSGSTENPIKIAKPGKYYLKSASQSNCGLDSDTAYIGLDATNAIIHKSGDRLSADPAYKYTWKLGNKVVSRNHTYQVVQIGTYHLLTESRFGCLDSTEVDIRQLIINELTHYQIIIYPNPVVGGQSIRIGGMGHEEPVRLEFYTMDGLLVMAMEMKGMEPIPIDLEPSVYLIKLRDKGQVYERKLIVL